MKTIRYLIITLIFQLSLLLNVNSQDCFDIKVLGLKKMHPVKQLPQLRAQEVMWHRRLWREIDLKEKINQLLYFPNNEEGRNCCLYDILHHQLIKGYIKAYDTKDDRFTKELAVSELVNLIGDSVFDENEQLVYRKLNSRDVVKYWLKEDWFYDSKNSKIDVRIIGICPVKVKVDKLGSVIGYQQLFWLYFPNLRGTLNDFEAYKKEKETDPRVSFDDVFIRRMFNSYVIQKESGERQYVKNHKTDLDIRLENEKTKQYYYKKETGLWGN